MHSAFHFPSKRTNDVPSSLNVSRNFAAVILFSLLGLTIMLALMSWLGAAAITEMLAQIN